MNQVHLFLADIWFGFIGLILMLYVILDGFDLGVGIISLFSRTEKHRSISMAALGSVWDANETWLVLLGGALFGAFPLVYGVVLHALYIPIMAILFGLIFRAVAFEFREQARRKHLWNIAFGLGSLIAALAEGFSLGALIAGLDVTSSRHYTGGVFDWLTPYAALVATGVVFGYVLLGATYLIVKTVGSLQANCYRIAAWAAWLTTAVGVGVSLLTPLKFTYVAHKWFGPSMYWLAILPTSAGIAFAMLIRSLGRRFEYAPFTWSILIFIVSFLGLAASLYPYIVPPVINVGKAAASSPTLIFMLTGIGLLIPVMLIYNAYQYVVFRGKVTETYGEAAE